MVARYAANRKGDCPGRAGGDSHMSTTRDLQCLTIKDVCQRLRISRQTVVRWIDSGLLPAVKIIGSVRIRESALAAFLKAHERGGGTVGASDTADFQWQAERRARSEIHVLWHTPTSWRVACAAGGGDREARRGSRVRAGAVAGLARRGSGGQ